jgi:hypothetical protein
MIILNELIEVLALLLLTAFFHAPLQFFLMRSSTRAQLRALAFSALINVTSWALYRLLYQEAFDRGRTGTFLSALVILNAIYYWLLLRFGVQDAESFKEERLFGWILFSPLITLMCLISTPLVGALLIFFVRAFA